MEESKTMTLSTGKEKRTLPPDAKIKNKRVRVEIEEIENGFLETKNYDISYETKTDKYGNLYYCTKTYHKDNPFVSENKELADFFE